MFFWSRLHKNGQVHWGLAATREHATGMDGLKSEFLARWWFSQVSSRFALCRSGCWPQVSSFSKLVRWFCTARPAAPPSDCQSTLQSSVHWQLVSAYWWLPVPQRPTGPPSAVRSPCSIVIHTHSIWRREVGQKQLARSFYFIFSSTAAIFQSHRVLLLGEHRLRFV